MVVRERESYVFVATAWGSQHGGINSLNKDLCLALAELEANVACVVEKATADEIQRADMDGVTLIALGHEPRAPALAPELVSALKNEGFTRSWFVGHDTITGELAVAAARLAKAPVVVMHHMHHLEYKRIEGEAPVKVFEHQQDQEALLTSADAVVAVGPSLFDSATDLLRDSGVPLSQIVPGLADVSLADRPRKFEAVVLGRFYDSSAKTKQLRLSVAAFGAAAADASGPLGQAPILTAYGAAGKGDAVHAKLASERAGRRIEVYPLPFELDREKLLSDLARKSVVMMLSWYEAFGLVAWEAIAAGVPLILSRASGAYAQLKHVLGEDADRLVEIVDILAVDDAQALNPKDIESIAAALKRVAADPQGATARVRDVRARLKAVDTTWRSAAVAFQKACPIAIVERFQEREQELVIAGRSETGGLVAQLCLVVDDPSGLRRKYSDRARALSRTRGMPPDVAASLLKRGLAGALSDESAREALIAFVAHAPVRAYVSVSRKLSGDELARGLISTRYSKRDLPVRTVSFAESSAPELVDYAGVTWEAVRPDDPLPQIRVERASIDSLTAVAEFMADALLRASLAGDRTFERLRLKFAHIYDADAPRNFNSSERYP